MNQKFINFGISADLRFWSMYGANFDRCFPGNTLPAAELCWDLAAECLRQGCRQYEERRWRNVTEMKVRGEKPLNSLKNRSIDVSNAVFSTRYHLWKEHQRGPVLLGEVIPTLVLKENHDLQGFKYGVCDQEYWPPACFLVQESFLGVIITLGAS